MVLLLRLFNSVIFMFMNLMVGLYTCRRFFRVMRIHYKLVAEVTEFNSIVCKSRDSLEYISSKVSEAMTEIEGDIGKELHVTHRLTKLSSKMALMLRRFTTLEECVIELVRMEHNTESVKIETPASINDEVKKVLNAKKKPVELALPKTPKKRKFSTTTFLGAKESVLQNPVSKFSAQQSFPSNIPKPEFNMPTPIFKFSTPPQIFIANNETIPEDVHSEEAIDTPPKPRTPVLRPVVKLLSERAPNSDNDQPIGFRPSWKICDAQ